ncbi:MAG: hypothetical protein MAG453_01863 [Calditrichaeota bacterium]|nr:hypothetical protein [Calditrichota bacterium]
MSTAGGTAAAIAILTLCLVAGCGFYTFGGAVPGHLNSVAIPIFENQTSEFGIAEDLYDALLDEFTTDNTLKVVDLRDADSVIQGVIVRVDDVPSTFSADESVEEYKVTITLRVSYRDLVKDKVVWEQTVSEFGIYPFSGGRSAREQGVQEALDKLTEDILNKTVSGW